MRLSSMLTSECIQILDPHAGLGTKDAVLVALAAMLARKTLCPQADILAELHARETIQSTGIGEGVAMPHGSLAALSAHHAAIVLSVSGFEFEALDARPVHIAVSLLGPKNQRGEHLTALARVSRVLRDASTRAQLLACTSGAQALELIRAAEAAAHGELGTAGAGQA